MVAGAPTQPNPATGGHRTYTLTPSQAAAFSRCPRNYHDVYLARRTETSTTPQAFGKYVHRVIQAWSGLPEDKRPADVRDVVRQIPQPTPLASAEMSTLARETARLALEGYIEFLEDLGVSKVLGSEQCIRTAPRRVQEAEFFIAFSACADVVAARTNSDELVCLDIKTRAGFLPTELELGDNPSSFIYDMVVKYKYGVESVCVTQLVPQTGQAVSARLDARQLALGREFCRSMARAVDAGCFPESPGQQCAYCPIVSTCSVYSCARPGWDGAF